MRAVGGAAVLVNIVPAIWSDLIRSVDGGRRRDEAFGAFDDL